MLKIKIRNQIIAGFICVTILILFIGSLGWYSVEKIEYIEGFAVIGYKINSAVLECRREEKNILLRGGVEKHIILWQKAFNELGRLSNALRDKRYVSYKQSELLTNALSAYKENFDAFINELRVKKVLNIEEINSYDGKFIISGRLLSVFSEKIIERSDLMWSEFAKKIRFRFLFFSIFGISAAVFLSGLTIRFTARSLKRIKQLNKELESNYLEFSLVLSEYFEALRRVSKGDLKIRVPESSPNELLAKFGKVLNQTIQQLNDFSSQEFEKIFVVSTSGMRVVDKDFNVIRTNMVMAQMSGLSVDEVVKRKCYEQFKGPYCYTDKCTLKEILGGAERIEREMYRIKQDGSKVFCLVSAVPLRDSKGSISGIVEDFTDITTMKQNETELELYSLKIALGLSEIFETLNKFSKGDFDIRIKEDKGDELLNKLAVIINETIAVVSKAWDSLESAKVYFENIINSINDIMIVMDIEFKVTSVNLATVDLLGYGKEDFSGKTVEELIMEKGSPLLFSNVVNQGLNNYETIFISKYGRKIPVLLSCSMIRDRNGSILYIVCTAKDISERKHSEEELKNAYASLKDLQSQLVQSEKMRAIGQLAGGIAHEINNPLTGVLNNAQLIKMMAGAGQAFKFDEIEELLDAIEESALRCKKITEALLDFSRASMEGFQPISLNAVINKVIGLIGNEMRLQNIELNLELPVDLPQVLGDSQLLQQILVNLISNAKWAVAEKFNRRGGLISIKTGKEAAKGFVNLYVTDNGIGIDEGKIAKIFNPFFTTKPVGEGTGLGLSVVYNIIKKHSGTIEVFSKKNEGTTFKVVLPAVF